jgi:hypothetical protein
MHRLSQDIDQDTDSLQYLQGIVQQWAHAGWDTAMAYELAFWKVSAIGDAYMFGYAPCATPTAVSHSLHYKSCLVAHDNVCAVNF